MAIPGEGIEGAEWMDAASVSDQGRTADAALLQPLLSHLQVWVDHDGARRCSHGSGAARGSGTFSQSPGCMTVGAGGGKSAELYQGPQSTLFLNIRSFPHHLPRTLRVGLL